MRRASHLGGIHEQGVCICGVRDHVVEGEHAKLEEGVVAAGRHVGQGETGQQLSHGLTILTLIHHLHGHTPHDTSASLLHWPCLVALIQTQNNLQAGIP